MRISDWSSDVCSSDLLGWRTVANIAGVDAPPPLAGSDSFRDNNSGRVGNVLNAPDRKASLWQFSGMHKTTVSRRMSLKLLDSLYVEAMVMADEARAYFDQQGDRDREEMDIMLRVSFSCESLKVTRSEEHTSELKSPMRTTY